MSTNIVDTPMQEAENVTVRAWGVLSRSDTFIMKISMVAIGYILTALTMVVFLHTFSDVAVYLQTDGWWIRVLVGGALGFLGGRVFGFHNNDENDTTVMATCVFGLLTGFMIGRIIYEESTHILYLGVIYFLVLHLICVCVLGMGEVDFKEINTFMSETTGGLFLFFVCIGALDFVLSSAIKYIVLAVVIAYLYFATLCMVVNKNEKDKPLRAGIDLYIHLVLKFVLMYATINKFIMHTT